VIVPEAPGRAIATRAKWWPLQRIDSGLLILAILFLVSLPLVTTRIYASDEIEYFSYLHSLWFDHDLNFRNEYMHFYESNPQKYADFKADLIDKTEPATGLPLNVAPMGCAVMWGPFYLIADAGVRLADLAGANVAADGYSAPYVWAVTYGSALYGMAALVLIYLLCRALFSRFASLLAVVTIWLATPVLFYMYMTPPMSHANSLFAVSLFVFIWYKTRGDRRMWGWVALGAAGGLMMLVREQDGLFAVIPAIESLWQYRERLFGRNWGRVVALLRGNIAFLVTMVVVFAPQLAAYKITNGHFGPSQTVSQKIIWSAPNALAVLFSPEHGLFVWSPIVIFGVIGLFFLFRKDKMLAVCLLVAFLAQVYMAGSFKTWSMAGSFGARRFVNATVVFALGLAALTTVLNRRVPKGVLAGVAAVFIAWNLGLVVQFGVPLMNRQALEWPKVAYNQVSVVPKEIWSIANRFLFNRTSFFR
jgi:hypothetical protein